MFDNNKKSLKIHSWPQNNTSWRNFVKVFWLLKNVFFLIESLLWHHYFSMCPYRTRPTACSVQHVTGIHCECLSQRQDTKKCLMKGLKSNSGFRRWHHFLPGQGQSRKEARVCAQTWEHADPKWTKTSFSFDFHMTYFWVTGRSSWNWTFGSELGTYILQ